jgi:DNA-binding NarL/FixJ family response regulator
VKKTQILVVDDHELVRRGIVGTIQTRRPDWEICGEATNGQEAVETAAKLNPDIIVMDISMPLMNGLEATRQILKRNPETEILILSMHDSEHLVRDVLNSGARGFVLKADAGDDLIAALDSLHEHKLFFTSKVAEVVLRGYLTTGSPHPTCPDLTPRERQIVKLIAEGGANKDISNTLGISVKTVETHRARLMDKLGFHSVAEVVRYALRNKLIESWSFSCS